MLLSSTQKLENVEGLLENSDEFDMFLLAISRILFDLSQQNNDDGISVGLDWRRVLHLIASYLLPRIQTVLWQWLFELMGKSHDDSGEKNSSNQEFVQFFIPLLVLLYLEQHYSSHASPGVNAIMFGLRSMYEGIGETQTFRAPNLSKSSPFHEADEGEEYSKLTASALLGLSDTRRTEEFGFDSVENELSTARVMENSEFGQI